MNSNGPSATSTPPHGHWRIVEKLRRDDPCLHPAAPDSPPSSSPLRRRHPRAALIARRATLGMVLVALIVGAPVGCSPRHPARVFRFVPEGLHESPMRAQGETRMGFEAPLGSTRVVDLAVPEGAAELLLACAMPFHGSADSAEVEILLEGPDVPRRTVFSGGIQRGAWTEACVDLRLLAGRQIKLSMACRAVDAQAEGAVCWATPRITVPGAPRLNIILVSIDALRADHLHCYGYPRPTSPTLDSLAAIGCRFTQVMAQASWTLPSHASLLTSLYVKSHGMTLWPDVLGADAPTLAAALRDDGYLTAALIGGALSSYHGLARGFDTYDQRCFIREGESDITNPCVERVAREWLERWRESPFFLFLHYWDVHDPYIPPAPYDTLFYPDYHGTVRGSQTIGGWRELRDRLRGGIRAFGPEDLQEIIALYDGEIVATDRSLSRLCATLRELGLARTALVVVTSDHGDEFLDHGKTGHGHTLFGELIHVPLVWAEPGGFHVARVNSELAQSIDIAPTILERVGLRAPPAMQGRSLLPAIRGQRQAPLPAFSEVIDFARDRGSMASVISHDTKLIMSTRTQRTKAFDLKRDRAEQLPISPAALAAGDSLERVLMQFVEPVTLEVHILGWQPGTIHLTVECVPPLAVSPFRLEPGDSVVTTRAPSTVQLKFTCPSGDEDGVRVVLPRTSHEIVIDTACDGQPIPARMVYLRSGDSPDRMPFSFRDRDPRLRRPSGCQTVPPMETAGIYVWIAGTSEAAWRADSLSNEERQRLVRLGYLDPQ